MGYYIDIFFDTPLINTHLTFYENHRRDNHRFTAISRSNVHNISESDQLVNYLLLVIFEWWVFVVIFASKVTVVLES